MYAIGEIVLVVVGILIALQINNHNIYKQQRSTERTYLIALKEEFIANTKILDETINLNNYIVNRCDSLIALFQKNVLDTIPENSVANYFFETFQDEIHYTPSTGVLREIIGSGNLKLILNQELKQRLASFESTLEQIRHQENEVKIPRLEIMELFRRHGNFERYLAEIGNDRYPWESIFESRSNKEMFTSLHMFNTLFFFQITSLATGDFFYQPLKEDLEMTIAMIDSELNKHQGRLQRN
jgi:hypothetical protein